MARFLASLLCVRPDLVENRGLRPSAYKEYALPSRFRAWFLVGGTSSSKQYVGTVDGIAKEKHCGTPLDKAALLGLSLGDNLVTHCLNLESAYTLSSCGIPQTVTLW